MRWAVALPFLLAACVNAPPAGWNAGVAAPPAGAQEPGFCRIGPDDGPVLAERGIGGTGAVAGTPSGQDRGIGGTGAVAAAQDRGIGGTGAVAEADNGKTGGQDRGIGGTGIVGVVTGFASICVNGLEVLYDDSLPVALEDGWARPDALRVGQLVVLEAGGEGQVLRARRMAVRYEVSGPVSSVSEGSDGRVLAVAGQRVRLDAATRGGTSWMPGDWITVSGLRDPDGAITATRIDRRPPGDVTVHGLLARDADGSLRIGALPVSPGAGIDLRPGSYVVASGPLSGNRMLARSVETDRLLTDLPASFGPGVGRFVVESYIGWDGRYLRPGYGLGPIAPPSPGGAAGRGVLDLRREPGRGIVATGLRNAPFAAGAGTPMGPQAPAMGATPGAGRGGAAGPRGTASPGAARPGPGGLAAPHGAPGTARAGTGSMGGPVGAPDAGGRWEAAPVPGGVARTT
ncbi:DUF5666 domain-containing protein [Roseomonas gilardii subsp. gilardii]|uniref:DUF5666 domain-containing protein n=1 Tax=Roseomonas gilardii TaxID=257708 RepID=UPI001FFA443F|nr:DUF5666 domain-containing protein [Roseomonas gilardii]UPG71817.1 DUF5666 domain-containing protein [Roseomonas gilardii subsp. gilardii]